MARTFDLILKNGTLVNHDGRRIANIGVIDGKIAEIGELAGADAGEVLDVQGLHVLPGVIDTQVHMREPGVEYKEDLEAGGRAAVLGGVTAVFEMPNTKPTTDTAEALEDKLARARHRMYCDHAFYVGATDRNIDKLGELESLPGAAGIKVFMGSSTGSLLVAEDEAVEAVLRNGRRRVAIHSEDEFRLQARKSLAEEGNVLTHPLVRDAEAAVICTNRLIALARKTGRRIHVLHISTAEEMPILAAHKDIATVETTPQHLTLFAPDCYEELGTLAQMNPPIRTKEHREGIWWGLEQGIVDVIGSDHAPHTLEEKQGTYPNTPSGMPGVQTLVPIMLDHVNAGRLSLERFVDLTSHGANRTFGIAGKGRLAVGYDADITIVDLKAKRVIDNSWIASKCGWTPFHGRQVTGWPVGTIVRGHKVMWEDQIIGAAPGEPIRFQETLRP
ncbi:MAG: dihydroorotase [Alphaproteobacteria bacterium]|nr:MAG: dihydroorotase [Alphaproteobacteria bacterium]